MYTYSILYHRTLSALPHDCLPTLELGTRSRISARFMAPGHETQCARRGDSPRAWGPSPRPSGDLCAEPLRLEGPLRKPEAFPLRGLSRPRTERVRGVASVGRSGPGEVLKINFGSGRPESVYAIQSAPSERMGSFGTEPQQAVVSWFCLLIARSCTHDIYMCVVALAEDLGARALKSSAQTKAPGNAPRATARPTQDGRRGLQRQRDWDGGCRPSRFRRKPEAFSLFRAMPSPGKVPKV